MPRCVVSRVAWCRCPGSGGGREDFLPPTTNSCFLFLQIVWLWCFQMLVALLDLVSSLPYIIFIPAITCLRAGWREMWQRVGWHAFSSPWTTCNVLYLCLYSLVGRGNYCRVLLNCISYWKYGLAAADRLLPWQGFRGTTKTTKTLVCYVYYTTINKYPVYLWACLFLVCLLRCKRLITGDMAKMVHNFFLSHYIEILHWYMVGCCAVEWSQYIKDSLFLLICFIL